MQKKTEPETFEARVIQARGSNRPLAPDAVELAREADQCIAQLTTDLAQARVDLGLCAQSAPLELVELVEEFIQTLERYDDQEELVNRAKATIERWKV